MPVTLDHIVPWGRSFDEYARMFALSAEDLGRTTVDCAAGPSSFGAESRRRGGRVVSVDPIYAFSPGQIRGRVEAVRDGMMDQVRRDPAPFVWEYFRTPDDLERVRMGAMERFLDDFSAPGAAAHYLPRTLPSLHFPDRAFELALCSHFLFLYSEQLGLPFHLASVRELSRVAPEVRIFPVTDLAGRPSPHLPAVRERFPTRLVGVPYEFLRGANEMLVIGQVGP